MLGFLVGTVCLIGLVKMLRRSHWRHARYGGWGHRPAMACGGGWGGGGPWDDDRAPWEGDERGGRGYGGWRGGRGEGFFLRMLFERLDTTAGQEKVIRAALGELRAKAREVKDDARDARGDLGQALRGETLDAETLGTVASRATGAVDALRDAAIGAVLKVHEVLEPRQREILADLLERGPRFRRWSRGGGAGPYRSAEV